MENDRKSSNEMFDQVVEAHNGHFHIKHILNFLTFYEDFFFIVSLHAMDQVQHPFFRP